MSMTHLMRVLPGPALAVVKAKWLRLIHTAHTACHPYRPELHYMRGPGPKWHAKHQARGEHGPILRAARQHF